MCMPVLQINDVWLMLVNKLDYLQVGRVNNCQYNHFIVKFTFWVHEEEILHYGDMFMDDSSHKQLECSGWFIIISIQSSWTQS